MNRIAVLLLTFAVLAVAACAGNLDDPERFTSALGARSADGPADAAPACPDVPALLADKCATAGCHSASAKAANLDLGSPNVTARLVDVPSMTTGKLVDPAQPSASVLFQRIQPTAAGRMPVTGDPLDDSTIACVLAWIGGLAKAAPAGAPASSSTSPPPSAPAATDGGAPAPRPTIRVAAGATGAYTDKSGAVWSADTGFSGGKTLVETVTVSGTDDATLYGGQRWGQDPNTGAGTPFTYAFDLPDGDYQVTLKFAEVYTGITAAGQRLFDVSIEGKAVLTSFDIFAAAGGRNIAVDKSFAVTVTGGKLRIDFTNGAANFAKIDAILVAPK